MRCIPLSRNLPSLSLNSAMTLLFERNATVETSFTTKLIPEQDGPDTVLLGKELWKSLLPTGNTTSRLLLSITTRQSNNSGSHPLQSISCWAIVDSKVSEPTVIFFFAQNVFMGSRLAIFLSPHIGWKSIATCFQGTTRNHLQDDFLLSPQQCLYASPRLY